MTKVLVTGAAGFIGSHTVDKLLANDHEVVGVDNFRSGHRANLAGADSNDRFSFGEADVSAEDTLDKLVAESGATAIIHLAALVSVQDSMDNPDLNYQLNILATHRVAEAARKNGVKRVVFASSAAIYGDATDLPIVEDTTKLPISPYGGAKLASEAILLSHGAAFGFTVRCQRYFNVFGPRQDPASPYSGVISIFDKRYRDGKGVTIFGDGQQTRDFISVHDVARANVIAATTEGISSGWANVCTGRATSLLEIAAIFGEHYPEAPPPILGETRKGDIIHSRGQADLIAKEIGFTAEVSVKDGLSELIRVG
jgi:UDP-glucose 4-epimerase